MRVLLGFALVVLCSTGALSQSQTADANISGTVMDGEGLGLGGVQVKVFVNGFLRGSGVSGADGGYSTDFRYDALGDETVVAWLIPQAPLVPEIIILRESESSKSLGLWSACLPRISLSPSILYDATIYSEPEKFEALGASDCI